MSNDLELQILCEELRLLEPEKGLKHIGELYPWKVVFSTSFGQEDQVIMDMIAGSEAKINVFTLDTGRLFNEIYDLWDTTQARYNINIIPYYPNNERVEQFVYIKGINSFYDSVENRKECCYIRKVEPLTRALKDNKVWITGLRTEQSNSRNDTKIIEWDSSNQIIKYNPLINWSYDDVLAYINAKAIPFNPLHNKGYISIGCAPCTRAIQPGEHPRAGRWWWEESHKECGLHKIKT